MGPRGRRLVASLGTVVFLIFYVWAVIAIGDHLPNSPWIDMAFFAVAGIAWGVPLFPLFKWAEGGKPKN
jgi:hypothetical protein